MTAVKTRIVAALLSSCLAVPAQGYRAGMGGVMFGYWMANQPGTAKSAEGIGTVAESITVRIEGATQGSGVIVKRDGDRYTVLTAWHVISGQRPGEEVDLYTLDGRKHSIDIREMERLGETDMAVLIFNSPNTYQVAAIGAAKTINVGSDLYVSGFPSSEADISTRQFHLYKGMVVSKKATPALDGYELSYSTNITEETTLPGVSGGPLLNSAGELVGIHGRSQTTNYAKTQRTDIIVKTGINNGIPIEYAVSTIQMPVAARSEHTGRQTHDDAQGRSEASCKDADSQDNYLSRANTELRRRSYERAIEIYSTLLSCYPRNAFAYNNRGAAKEALGDERGAASDYRQALVIDSDYFYARENLKNLGQ